VFFLLLSGLALRLRLKTGQQNQWLYAGVFGALVCLVIVIVNLQGHALAGV
jgi:hypothetical protein